MKTPKQRVKRIYAYAVSDYYESMPSAYFIRVDIQGKPISDLCASPRLAWLNAYLRLRDRGILA